MIRYCLVLTTFLLTYIESHTQPLAPRNKVVKKNMIEVYSACKCAFCIEADSILLEQKGGCMINVISYHSGPLAVPPFPNVPDLRTHCGSALHDSFKIRSYPSGIWNRSTQSMSFNQWFPLRGGSLYADVSMGMLNQYNKDSNACNLRIECYPFEEYIDSTLFLSVFLIENGIVAPQINHSGQWINNYQHHFVFRAPISSCFGDKISSIRPLNEVNLYYRYIIPSHINPKNSIIVAFITNVKGEIINSENIAATGAKTNVSGVLSGLTNNIWETDLNEERYDTLKFISYFPKYSTYNIQLHKSDSKLNAGIRIWPSPLTNTIHTGMNYLDSIEIILKVGPQLEQKYGFLKIEINPDSFDNRCGIHFFKDYHLQIGKENLIVSNTALLRNGHSNKVPLYEPVEQVFKKRGCENYCRITDLEFLKYVKMREILKMPPLKNIYYMAGWGQPIFPEDMIDLLDRSLENGTNLVLSGQDIGYSLGRNHNMLPAGGLEWFRDKIGVFYQIDGDHTMSTMEYDYIEPLFGDLKKFTLQPVYGNGSEFNITPDEIWIDPQKATQFIFNRRNRCTGFYKQNTNSKLVMLSFGLEMIVELESRDQLISRIDRWLGNCDPLSNNSYNEEDELKKDKDTSPFKLSWINDQLKIRGNDQNENFNLQMYHLDGRLILSSPIYAYHSEQIIPTGSEPYTYYFYTILNKKMEIIQKGMIIKMTYR